MNDPCIDGLHVDHMMHNEFPPRSQRGRRDMASLVEEKDEAEVLWKREISSKLFEKINLSQYGLSSSETELVTKAQTNLALVLGSKASDGVSDNKTFCSVLMKIASKSSPQDLDIQRYIFTRVEEILGLSVDMSDIDSVVYGHHRAGQCILLLQ